MTTTNTVLSDSPGRAGASIPRILGGRTRKMAFVRMNISSYTNNGDSFSALAADLGFNEITTVSVSNVSGSTTAAYFFTVNLSTKVVIAFTATGTQAGAVAIDSLHLTIVGY